MNERNKKAQIAETMTWTAATIIIIIILVLFIFAISLIAPKKNVVFGLGSFIEDAGSSFYSQQMLLAVLNKKSSTGKTVSQLIAEKNMQAASAEIDSMLTEFSQKGVKCSFVVWEGKPSTSSDISIGNSPILAVDKIDISFLPKTSKSTASNNKIYIKMECIREGK